MLKVILRVSKINSVHHKLQLSLHTAESNIHFLIHRRWQTAWLPQEASVRVLCLLEGEVSAAMTLSSHHEHPVGYYPLIMSYPTAVCSYGIALGLPSKPHRVFISSFLLIHHS